MHNMQRALRAAAGNPITLPIKLVVITIIMAAIIITHTSCGDKEPVSKTDFALDTTCQITVYDDLDEEKAQQILDETFKEIRRYEGIFSKTIDDSEITRINNSAGQWVEVSDETTDVIRMANIIAYESYGAFDITIGAVTDLWNFKSENPKVPDAADIEAALSTVGYQNMTSGGGKVHVSNPETKIDLGGIAKGYIADKAAEFMERQGITKAIINLGGNVVVIGEKDEETPWTIGIERPFSDRTEIIGTVQVTDATLVTSGIYERKFEQNGIIYHHILDTKTGYPVDTDLEAVTIVAAKGNSGFCDAVSTACLIMGKDKALEYIKAIQTKYPDIKLEAALIDKNDNIIQTEGMKIQLSEK